jgi:hypothetical protein
MRRYYANDPRWIKVKFASKCSRCSVVLRKGDDALYFPLSKSLFCEGENCGGREWREFRAAAEDEAFMGG